MSLYIDKKFVTLLLPKVERFVKKGTDLYNLRCPFCGDSKKNKYKARGYFYRNKGNFAYRCHNCNVSMSLGNFIKSIDPTLYQEYQMETYKDGNHSNVAHPDFSHLSAKPVFEKKVINLPSIKSLADDHPAKVYCVKRKIPDLTEVYYTDDFAAFAKTITSKEKDIPPKDQRIVFPFLDQNKNLLGVQGRTISDSKIRYITLKTSDDSKKVYGLHKVDFTKPIYVVEGPIDSMFLPNCVALMDSALSKVIDLLGDHSFVFIYDNEPRNKEILRQMQKSIATGKNIVVWPKDLVYKDINDMVLAGLDVMKIISENTFDGLRAKLEFEMWRKV